MIDSDEQTPALAHHMTWIHNFPKCDSCVTMNAAGRGRHPLGHRYSVAMVSDESSRGLNQGANFLPGIVRGRSMERKKRLEVGCKQCRSNVGQTSKDHMQLPHPNTSNHLPHISTFNRSNDNLSPTTQFKMGITRAQQRLAKSLDLDEHSKINVKRRVSLPSLTSDNLKLTSCSSGTSASDSGVYDVTQEEDDVTLLSRVSLEETDSDEQNNSNLTIDPFPYQSERSPYESDVDRPHPKPPTPIKPKKKKKKKPAPPPPPKPRPKKAKKAYVKRKPPINFAALRRHEQEVARRLPIKKQFLYSNALESELQSYIPPRIPGGRLKTVYKRTQTGDIMVPEDPITVEYTELKNETEDDNVSPWQRRRQEALQAFLERRRKLQKRVSSRDKRNRVRFILPPGHIDSASEKDDDEEKPDNIDHAGSGADIDELDNHDSPQRNDDGEGAQPSRVSLVVEEALRTLESTPSQKDSDELVQNWLQTTKDDSINDRRVVERTSITDQFVKLPKISETISAFPMISDNPSRQLLDASNMTVIVTEVIDKTGVS